MNTATIGVTGKVQRRNWLPVHATGTAAQRTRIPTAGFMSHKTPDRKHTSTHTAVKLHCYVELWSYEDGDDGTS